MIITIVMRKNSKKSPLKPHLCLISVPLKNRVFQQQITSIVAQRWDISSLDSQGKDRILSLISRKKIRKHAWIRPINLP
jgi:hypothetical protein